MFFYIFSTKYQKIGDLFCPVIFLNFCTVWHIVDNRCLELTVLTFILFLKEKDELNDLNDAIKRLANRIRESLKIQQDNIQKNKEEATNSSLQQNDQKIRLTQVQAQTKQFQKVWNEYNDSQLDFRKESKTTLIRQAKITGNIHLTDEKVEEMIDKGKVYILG